MIDDERCYAAVQSRDARFDGWFVTAVRTTGIYCRPSCPAITPRRGNVRFFPAAATAQQHGYRACKRCRPDAAPGSPEWDVRQDATGRAMRLIGDGVVDREGVRGLARRLGYSERHLTRLMTEELGAGPLAIARAQRAHTARTLIETTDLRLTDIAFAAGFGSVRQFNDTVRHVFAASPSDLRAAATRAGARSSAAPERAPGAVDLRLPVRTPFAGPGLLGFCGARAIPRLEHWDGAVYRRTLRLPAGFGAVSARVHEAHVEVRLQLTDWRDLGVAVQRMRRMLDLDADPVAIDGSLGTDTALAPLVRAVPGRRAPASPDPFETLVRAVVGQQVSVAGARTVGRRLVERFGDPLSIGGEALGVVFPSPEALADADPAGWAMPRSRAATIGAAATAVADGTLVLDPGVDPDVLRRGLLAIPGIGPWTADHVLMRGLGHPDVFLSTDLAIVRTLAARRIDADQVATWAPWRSYAVHHLWAAAARSPSAAGDLSASEASVPGPPPTATPSDRRSTAPSTDGESRTDLQEVS